MGSTAYHEPTSELSPEVRNRHRALASLMEELEAIDWYAQRADVCDDDALKRILLHNLDEEMEHACMALEWLRRRMPAFDAKLRTYLFTDTEITAIEEEETGSDPPAANASGNGRSASAGDLGIRQG